MIVHTEWLGGHSREKEDGVGTEKPSTGVTWAVAPQIIVEKDHSDHDVEGGPAWDRGGCGEVGAFQVI